MSEVQDRVVMWYGQRVDDMTRDELMEAFQKLARMHKRQTGEHLRQLSVLGNLPNAHGRRW